MAVLLVVQLAALARTAADAHVQRLLDAAGSGMVAPRARVRQIFYLPTYLPYLTYLPYPRYLTYLSYPTLPHVHMSRCWTITLLWGWSSSCSRGRSPAIW